MRTSVQSMQLPPFPELQGELFSQMESTVYKHFLDFHIKFPQVYILFEKFALQLIAKGETKLGSKMIIERIRWEIKTNSKDNDGFKINNNFTAHYSRLFIKYNPLYKDYFEFREIKRL